MSDYVMVSAPMPDSHLSAAVHTHDNFNDLKKKNLKCGRLYWCPPSCSGSCVIDCGVNNGLDYKFFFYSNSKKALTGQVFIQRVSRGFRFATYQTFLSVAIETVLPAWWVQAAITSELFRLAMTQITSRNTKGDKGKPSTHLALFWYWKTCFLCSFDH